MIPGDMIRIPDSKHSYESLPLWDDPHDYSSANMNNINGHLRRNDTGIILEQQVIPEVPCGFPYTWIKVLCSEGIGWVRGVEVEFL